MSLKRLLSALVVASMVFTLVVPSALAADTSTGDMIQQAVKMLQGFGIVKGRPDGMHLNDTITRAELMTVLIRASGKEADAALLRGANAFPDTGNHWASGYIALAKAMGLTIGYPDGYFRPDNKVTYGEMIAFLDRLVGLDISKAPGTFPHNYIKAAVDAAMIPPGIDADKVANEYAIRGYVFVVAHLAFGTVKLASGKTIYQTYFKTTAPTVAIDQGLTVSTAKESVDITGSVSPDAVALSVGGKDVALSNGTFKYTASALKVGANDITFVATDMVGNTGTAKITISRAAGPLAAVVPSVTDKQEIAAGSTTAVSAKAKDSFGNDVANAAVTITATTGKVDDKGNYTAPEKVGTDTLTFTSGSIKATVTINIVADVLSTIVIAPKDPTLALGQGQKFTATGADKFGNPVNLTGTVVWSASAGVIDQQGNFAGTVGGKTTITATLDKVSGTSTATVFGVPTALAVTLSKSSFTANGSSTLTATATVVDANNIAVGNWNGNITFTMTDTTVAGLGASGTSNTLTVAAVNGVATTTVTAGSTVGSSVLQATATGLAGGIATVTTNAQSMASVSISADPATLAADGNSSTTIKVKLLDQDGQTMGKVPAGGVIVTLQQTPATSSVATLQNANSTVSFAAGASAVSTLPTVIAGSTLGSITISAKSITKGDSTALNVTSNSVTITTAPILGANNLTVDTIAAASAKDTVSDGSDVQTVVVRVRDVNGNQVTGVNGTFNVTLSVDSGTAWLSTSSSGGFAPASSLNNATANGKAAFYVKDPTAGTNSYSATAQAVAPNPNLNGSLAKVTAAGVINAGPAANLVLSPTPGAGYFVAVGSGKAVLKAQVVDSAAGPNGPNVVTNGTTAVTFSRTIGSNFVWSGTQTVNTINGVAAVNIQAGTTIGTDTFQATASVGGTTPAPAVATLTTAVIGPSAQLTFSGANTLSAQAGTNNKVKVLVQDGQVAPNTQVNTTDNSTVVTLTTTDSNLTSTTQTATASYGVATFTLNLTSADTYTLKATAVGLKGADGSGNPTVAYSITPSSATQLVVSASPSTVGADGISAGKLKVRVGDQYGNNVTVAANTLNGPLKTVTPSANTNSGVVSVSTAAAGYFAADCVSTQYPQPAPAAPINVSSDNASCVVFGFTATSSTGGQAVVTVSGANPYLGTTIANGTATITTVPVYAAHHMVMSVDQSAFDTSAAGTTGTQQTQTVTVVLVDQNGTTVTAPTTANVDIVPDPAGGYSALPTAGCLAVGFSSGKATCAFTNPRAETVSYTATYRPGASGTTLSPSNSIASVNGTFIAGKAQGIVVSNANPQFLMGNGSTISTIKVRVVDNIAGKANVVTSANGTVTLQISAASQYAFLQGQAADGTLTVPVTNGVATATLQSKPATDPSWVSVTANWTSGDGSATFTGSNAKVAYVFKNGDTTQVGAPVQGVWGGTASAPTITLTFTAPVRSVTVGTVAGNAVAATAATTASASPSPDYLVWTLTFNGTMQAGANAPVNFVGYDNVAGVQITVIR